MGEKRTDLTWNSRLVGVESYFPGTFAWSRHLSAHNADHQGGLSGKFRLAFPLITPHGGEGLG